MVFQYTLRENCPYSEFFCSVFSHIWTEYGEIKSISPFSTGMRENTDKKNSEYGHFKNLFHLFLHINSENKEPSISFKKSNIPTFKYLIFIEKLVAVGAWLY